MLLLLFLAFNRMDLLRWCCGEDNTIILLFACSPPEFLSSSEFLPSTPEWFSFASVSGVADAFLVRVCCCPSFLCCLSEWHTSAVPSPAHSVVVAAGSSLSITESNREHGLEQQLNTLRHDGGCALATGPRENDESPPCCCCCCWWLKLLTELLSCPWRRSEESPVAAEAPWCLPFKHPNGFWVVNCWDFWDVGDQTENCDRFSSNEFWDRNFDWLNGRQPSSEAGKSTEHEGVAPKSMGV